MHNSNIVNKIDDNDSLDPVVFFNIKKNIGEISLDEFGINKIYEWKQKEFKIEKDRYMDKKIGQPIIKEVFAKGKLNGCHQHGLVLKFILEKYGFPTKIIETINKKGAYNKEKGKYSGHVLLRVYVNSMRKILDTTNESCVFLEQDPVTTIIGNKRYPFAEGKSLVEMKIFDQESLHKGMLDADKEMHIKILKNKLYQIPKRIVNLFHFSTKK